MPELAMEAPTTRDHLERHAKQCQARRYPFSAPNLQFYAR